MRESFEVVKNSLSYQYKSSAKDLKYAFETKQKLIERETRIR